jgi:hypothetical protein
VSLPFRQGERLKRALIEPLAIVADTARWYREDGLCFWCHELIRYAVRVARTQDGDECPLVRGNVVPARQEYEEQFSPVLVPSLELDFEVTDMIVAGDADAYEPGADDRGFGITPGRFPNNRPPEPHEGNGNAQ